MMNMVLSYQCCMPMTRGSLCPLPTLNSCTKKTNLCFSTPLLFGRKMPCITGSSSSSLLASPSKAADVSKSYPLLMIPPSEKDEDGRGLCRFYDYLYKKDVNTNIKIPEEVDDAICVGSSHGWLAYISSLDCSIFLWSPFTTSPLIYLPPIHTLPSITVIHHEELYEEESDDVLEIVDGDTVYSTCRSSYESNEDVSPDFWFKVERDYPSQRCFYTSSPKHMSRYFIRKIILSSAPTSDDCIVVALPRVTSIRRSIAFCKPGDKSWTFVEPVPLLKEYLPIIDVIHFKDQLFYAISDCGTRLYAYDLRDLFSPKTYLVKTYFSFERLSLDEQRWRSCCTETYYLVESRGYLLLVRRLITDSMNHDCKFIFSDYDQFPDKTITFDVYSLNFSWNTWWHCTTEYIGDQVLFLGTNQSLSLSARDFPILKANCIYFTDDYSTGLHKKYPPYGDHDYGHCKLGGYAFGEFYGFGDDKVLTPPFWVMRHFH